MPPYHNPSSKTPSLPHLLVVSEVLAHLLFDALLISGLIIRGLLITIIILGSIDIMKLAIKVSVHLNALWNRR
jgi:hypothetical protein